MTTAPTIVLARGVAAPETCAEQPFLTVRACAAKESGAPLVQILCDGKVQAFASDGDDTDARIDLSTLPGRYALDACVRVMTSPWERAFSISSPPRGRRTFVVAVLGWQGDEWLDGPLAHILPSGNVASFIPSGGPATLTLRHAPPSFPSSLTWEDALEMEGTQAQRAHRCLTAALEARMPAPEVSLDLWADELTPTSAVALAMVRQARPETTVRLAVRGGARALTPPWRRFTENAGIVVRAEGDGQALSSLARVLPAERVLAVASVVNSISDLLPKSLLSE